MHTLYNLTGEERAQVEVALEMGARIVLDIKDRPPLKFIPVQCENFFVVVDGSTQEKAMERAVVAGDELYAARMVEYKKRNQPPKFLQ